MADSHCKSCGLVIVYALTENGKRMPVDEHPTGDDGNLVLIRRAGKVMVVPYDEKKHAGWARRVSHFASCAFAAEHRKARP